MLVLTSYQLAVTKVNPPDGRRVTQSVFDTICPYDDECDLTLPTENHLDSFYYEMQQTNVITWHIL